MATLELAAEKLEVLARAEADRRTAVEELLKASLEETNIEELLEELVDASREVGKAEEKLTKLAEVKEAARSAAQGLVYAVDDYCMAESEFVMAVMNWETAQERCQIQHREGDEIQGLMVGQMCPPKKRVRTGRILPARQGACLPLLTPTIRPSTNSELIQALGHHRGPMLPPQVPPPQPDSDFSTLNANAGVPSLLTHPLMDMGFPHADLPRCERVAMDAIHQTDAGFNMSKFGAGPSFSMPPRSRGADMSISLNEDAGFRKPSTKPYLHRRQGLKPALYDTHRLDNHAEKFAIAVRDRLEAAEELVQVAKEAAGAKQKIHLNSLTKAKENLTKATDEAANEEKWFRRRVDSAEFMSRPYLMWHRHWQEKRSSQKQGTISLFQEERSLPEKRKRSRAQEERSSEMSWKKISLLPSRSSSVIIRNYSNCLRGCRGDTE